MEQIKQCKALTSLLDKKLADSNARWQMFLTSQSNYKSKIRCDGKVLPSPVMTAEKRRQMQLYRKQAYIVEVRMKSRSREKAFLTKIQGAIDEVRDFHIDTGDSSDEVDGEFVETSFSSSSKFVTDTNCLHASSHGNAKHQPQQPVTPESNSDDICQSGEHNKTKSTIDLTQVGKPQPSNSEAAKMATKIRRQRSYSEGKSESNSQTVELTKPCQSSSSPNHSKKWHSSSNLLTIPFEQYQRQVEETESLSRPRQRYREERTRANAFRTPSPQRRAVSLHSRPASTPPMISTAKEEQHININECDSKDAQKYFNKPLEKVSMVSTQQTVSCKALKSLLENLDPCHDQPTHQWLTARVSDQEKNSQEDISLEDWFQNAPDSVKQKLATLLPKVSNYTGQQTDNRKVVSKSVDIQVSPVQMCDSSDDTLRSTSPIAEVDRSLHCESLKEYPEYPVIAEVIPLFVIDKSPPTSQNSTKSLNRAESYTVLEPSSTSLDTVIEVESISQMRREEPLVPPLPLLPADSTLSDAESIPDTNVNLPKTSAGERKRSLSMQSYTVDEPSEALINFTLNSTYDEFVATPMAKRIINQKTSSPENNQSRTDKVSPNNALGGRSLPKESVKDAGDTVSIKQFKSRIPTPKAVHILLSKCNLDTPSPVVCTDDSMSEITRECPDKPLNTPVNAARHRQLVRLANQDLPEMRSMTPTPPGRALTPIPPNRPKSENGTHWSRSRSQSQNRETKDNVKEKKSKKEMSRRLNYTASDTENHNMIVSKHNIVRSKSCRVTSGHETEEGKRPGRVKRSGMSNKADGEEKVEPSYCANVEESPLKDYEGKRDKLSRARKQLALLKSKFLAIANSKGIILKPETQVAISEACVDDTHNSRNSKSPVKPAKVLNSSQSPVADGKENSVVGVRLHSRSSIKSLYREREETPIGTVHSAVDGTGEISVLGNVLAVSHKTNRIFSADNHQQREVISADSHIPRHLEATVESSGVHKQSQVLGNDKLYGLIKGHLCRKLFKCSKVKSTIKTIQDCKNLLPSILLANSNSAIHDVNFQQKLKLQMAVAKRDLHDILFGLPSYQRMSLIKQSEMVLARHRLRQINKGKTADMNAKSANHTRHLQTKSKRKGDSLNVFTKPRILSTGTSVLRHISGIRNTGTMKPVIV